MTRLIKKYKNRRLYDMALSQYVTLDQLHHYVIEGLDFRIEDSESGKDLTNAILLQIIADREAGPTPFLSPEVLRQIIILANHPMHASLKAAMEHLFQAMNQPLQADPFQQATKVWQDQMENMVQRWQQLFKP